MPHDARMWIFLICENRATVKASRIDTMMTRGGDCLLVWIAPVFTLEKSNIPPTLALIEAIQGMTGGDTRLAPAALVQFDLEAVLLPDTRSRQWYQFAIPLGNAWVIVVPFREFLRGSKLMLIGKQSPHVQLLRTLGRTGIDAHEGRVSLKYSCSVLRS
jgi:hypothetical protein